MLRSKKDALRNLNLGQSFFDKMLVLVDNTGTSDDKSHDYDIYLMEKSVMPLLVQGLDALSRHVSKMATGEKGVGPSLAPFNPLSWLAQFLLRNHPKYIRDHRTPIYESFADKASIEKGRRCLLRKKSEILEAFQVMREELKREGMWTKDLPNLVRRLDIVWGLHGALATRMPANYSGLVRVSDEGVLFSDFWEWFEKHVRSNDVLRESAFEAAAKRRAEDEKQARRQREEVQKRERQMQEALEQQQLLREQFEQLSTDMYLNDEIARIMNKGAVIQGVEEKDQGVPLQGEHIALILAMLGLWGRFRTRQADDVVEDVWDELAVSAWAGLMENRGMQPTSPGPNSAPRVDAASLNLLMDKTAFEAFLVKAYPLHASDLEEMDTSATVQVKRFSDDEEYVVEVVDEETGKVMHLQLQGEQVEEMKKRLAEGGSGSGPVYATVDLICNRISEIVPEGQ